MPVPRHLSSSNVFRKQSALPAAELGAGDGGGDSYVEALGSLAGRVVVGDVVTGTGTCHDFI